MNNRPTPETDAVAEKLNFGVDIDFARKLEQERDEARAERDILRSNKMSDPLLETTFKHLNRERDEACQVANGLAKQVERLRKERDEAREEIRDWKRLHDAAERGVDLTIAEGTISDLRKQRDEWSAMCSRYKQERDIAEQDATNYHARIIELIAERDKTKQERDEARDKYDKLATEHILAVNKLCEERDEAREQVNRYRYNLDLLPIKWDI